MRAGRTPGFLPLPSQGEIPPRSPQALGSQNNPAGEGRKAEEGGREAGGAHSFLRGACRCLWGEKKAWEGYGE